MFCGRALHKYSNCCPNVPFQAPHVLVTLLLPDDHDAEHDGDTEGGGDLRRVQERTFCEPPLSSDSGQVGGGETSRRACFGVETVSG